jgi:hypothetical protein
MVESISWSKAAHLMVARKRGRKEGRENKVSKYTLPGSFVLQTVFFLHFYYKVYLEESFLNF